MRYLVEGDLTGKRAAPDKATGEYREYLEIKGYGFTQSLKCSNPQLTANIAVGSKVRAMGEYLTFAQKTFPGAVDQLEVIKGRVAA